MIVTRYRENKNFKPKTFFTLKAQFDKDHIEFTGSLQTQGIDNSEVDSEGRIVGKSLATTIKDAWSNARFGNANWFQELFDTTDEIKLLKEQTYMPLNQNARNIFT